MENFRKGPLISINCETNNGPVKCAPPNFYSWVPLYTQLPAQAGLSLRVVVRAFFSPKMRQDKVKYKQTSTLMGNYFGG